MELTFESAFSPAGSLGHLAYILLIASMLMRRMVLLRLLVIASALVGIAYSSLILTDPVSTFWEGLLVAVNIVQLSLTWWMDRVTQFDARDAAFRAAHLPELSPSGFRKLIDSGTWRSIGPGASLTTEGQPVAALHYLRSGSARVLVRNREVARTGGNSFVGEMTILAGEPAFATVIIDEAAEVWSIDAAKLRDLRRLRPDIGQALEAAFFRTVRGRLVDRNMRDILGEIA